MLKRMRSFLVAAMLMVIATVSAQVTTSSMSGKVTAQDEPIIGATVVAIHEPSGTRYGTVTNISGQFNLQGMRTGLLTKLKFLMLVIRLLFIKV